MLLYTCSDVGTSQFYKKLNTYWLSKKPLPIYGKNTFLVDVTLPTEKQVGYTTLGYENGFSAWGMQEDHGFTTAYSVTHDLINRVWRLKSGETVKLSELVISRPNYINKPTLFKSNSLFIYGQTKMLMFDWDMPDTGHKTDKCITIQTREDVLPIVNAYVEQNPGSRFILEQTPGGVRGWELSRPYTQREGAKIQLKLKCDKLYIGLCVKSSCFYTRVSKKPDKDFVASPWMSIGSGEIHPELKPVWSQYKRLVKYFE